MSRILVVAKGGVAAVAADTLTTHYSSKDSAEYVVNHQKIIQVGNTYLGITGPASAKLAIGAYFAEDPSVSLNSVDAIFAAWTKLHSVLKEQYFLNPEEDKEDAFESTRVDVLIANPD